MAFSLMQTISFIYLLVVLNCTASSLLSHDEECSDLFDFKQSIFHQDGSENGSDCCLWEGVECSEKGQVIRLDFSQSFLRGPINSKSTLFNLVHLQMLNLSMNDFLESKIPSQIGRLTQLRSLDLSYSGFSGQIPNEISELVQLSSLDLSGNPLMLLSPSLGYLLQNLTRLEELHLSGVDISSSVPHFLANFSSLRSIKLEDCGLQDDFPSKIFHLPKLKHLSMRYNSYLTGYLPEFSNNTLLAHLDLGLTSFAGIIPESISNLNHLELFSLSNCYFSGHIPGSISNMTQIKHLFLDQNELTGPVPSFSSLSNLITLKLSYNNFDKGSIPYWLNKLTNLNELYLSGMNIFHEIPSFFSNLTKLNVVQMRENFISGQIPSSFMNLTQLVVVDLQRNQLQGPISRKFSNFKSLEILNLDHNNFSGQVQLDTFVGLNKLERLYLNSNNISFVTTNNYTDGTLPQLEYLGLASCNLKEFPAFLSFQKKMIGLFLDENKIDGLVPAWFWNNSKETMRIIDISHNFINGFHQSPRFLPWVRLEAFVISYNQLLGQIPIPPHTTEFYDVSNNLFTGEIPPSICEVKSLRYLDLSSNNMTGPLPPCLGDLSNSLLVLDLKQNHFHGTMMNTFTSGSLLKRIDLSENRFIGKLPKSLANCTNLEVLSLGDNSFNDVFPFWLGTLDKLQVLILRSNKFYGAIQVHTIGRSWFSKLRIIDLSNNGFSGQLPKRYFQSWNVMKSVSGGKLFAMNSNMQFDSFVKLNPYSMTLTNKGVKREYETILNVFTAIDLSCNNFEGKIPQSLQDLHGLESLNLSNNHLTGRILPSLGNLRNLESLDLSHNELSGEIPQQLLQLGFLAVLNVSFNHLDGPVPQGKQFNTFQNNSYMGNSRLCGEPLSKECRTSKTPTLAPTGRKGSNSLIPSERIDWIVIFSGVVSGLVIGTVFGNSRSTWYSHWLIERLGMKKERWVRPLRNTTRS